MSESIENKNLYIIQKSPQNFPIKSKDTNNAFTDYPLSLSISYFAAGVEGAIAASVKGASYIGNGLTIALLFISFNSAFILIKMF